MKQITLILFLFNLLIASAQPYGNEWINYSQKYYSFKIYQEGIYRIDYTTLNLAGIPLTTISSDNYQLFGREKEVEIYVNDGGDGFIDPGDYIEFYANKNDAWLDSLIYTSPNYVSNPRYSLYNDTINYYLSWNSTGSNQRVVVETDVNFSAFTPLNYFLKTGFFQYTQTYIEGAKQSGLSSSFFTEGEGWMRDGINAIPSGAQSFVYVPTTNIYTGVGAPDVMGLSVTAGMSNASYTGQGNHHFSLNKGTVLIKDTIYLGYKLIKIPFILQATDLVQGTTPFTYNFINDQGAASDYQAIAFIDLVYPHTLDFENLSFDKIISPINSVESKSRYDITNFNISNPLIYALGDVVRKIPSQINAGVLQFLIPNNISSQNDLIVLDESEVQMVSTLNPINGSGLFTDYSNFNTDNYLIISETSLMTSVSQYEAYRESATGGGHSVYSADVNELYHQFGGGIEKHALAIKRYVDFFVDISTVAPEYVFYIGKGIREANESNVLTGLGSRKSPSSFASNLVPSWGYPASDILLTAGLDGNKWEPLLATGRLSANVPQDVLNYLSKIQTYEAEQDPNSVYSLATKEWQKQVMHFGGGSTASEQDLFKAYLQSFENKVEDVNYGGNVFSTYKTTSDPIDPVTSQEVTERINSGVSIMTFFGHASSTGFDQNVDEPENWSNYGKYPLLIGNACYTGDIYQPNPNSISERFVMLPDRGSIAFLSSVKLGFAQSLFVYSDELYKQFSSLRYGEGFGKQMKATINAVEIPGGSIPLETACVGMVLHGDPAFKINWHQNPEFEILPSSMIFKPEIINLTVDTIEVGLILTNIGEATDASFIVELRRKFPNSTSDSVYTKVINGLHYKDTIWFKMPLDPNNGTGTNEFSAKVDIPTSIVEQYDDVFNNQITVPLVIQIDGIYPVWPYDFAVVPKDTITLKASTNNPLVGNKLYHFEVDTTDLFNSPFRKKHDIAQLGGVVEVAYNVWENADNGSPEILILEDSVVYFWRVSMDSSIIVWNESSFQFISGQEGWGQSHFFQFKNNTFSNLEYNRSQRKRNFFPDAKIINCSVFGNSTDNNELLLTDWRIDGEVQEYGLCTLTPSIIIGVIDPVTLDSWGTAYGGENPTHSFGNANDGAACRARVEKYFIFRQNDAASLASFEDMILNQIPDSFYVLIYTTTYADYASWDALYPSTYNVFQSLGSDSIIAGKPNVPFILFTKKGDLSVTQESYGTDITDNIVLNDTLYGYDYIGEEKSNIIGPAFNWNTIYWSQSSEDIPITDSSRLQVYGLTAGMLEVLLIDTLLTSNDSILNLNSIIPASIYPTIRLKSYLKDSVNFTPAQLSRWHVLFSPVPEAAIDGTFGYYWNAPDTLQEGMDVSAAFHIKNISDYHMDSLLVNYWLQDKDRNIFPINYPRRDSLRVASEIFDTITFNTAGFSGQNILWVEVNPYINATEQDQLEMFHFNNLAQIPFYVKPDEINPVLDVTFDGTHILNGDLVSGKVQIVISLNDENQFLFMDSDEDTTNFGIFVTDPLGVQKRIPFLGGSGEIVMQWIPSTNSENKFKIIYDGEFLLDGKYQLLVQGNDVSGNNSGDVEYRVDFEVINKSTITYLMNYPNPFSTSTRFVFTLTGNEVPDEMTIQILSVSGKLVKTITLQEFGTIKVGNNISEYAWDGRDDWGDQLANGVYLYTVNMRINGENIEHRGNQSDSYFKKEFGKMYLLR